MLNRKILKARLGIFDKETVIKEGVSDGYDENAKRLDIAGGNLQQQRMIRGKQQSLDRALWFSYQAAEVQKLGDSQVVRALINPNKVKQDYDDKIISIHYAHNYKPGDIFEWKGTQTYWLIYLQELTELAYFRGDIRKCSYEIHWEDADGNEQLTYAAVRGPVETEITSKQKHTTIIDEPNRTLHILIPKNEETLLYFKRYTEFYMRDIGATDADDTCWRVTAVDAISTPGILEFTAIEYYANEYEDDLEKGLVGVKVKPIDPTPDTSIIGETFIKPRLSYTYECAGSGVWAFSRDDLPIQIKEKTDSTIEIVWTSSYTGQFDIKHGDIVKTIVVESLF